MVSVSGVRIRRRPIADIPMPVMATRSSNFSEATIGRTRDVGQRRVRGLGCRVRAGIGRRGEDREPHVVVLLEPNADAQAHVHGVGLRVDDVGDEAHAWVLVERDDRDDVRRRELGEPLLQVEREPDHHALTRGVRGLELDVVAVAAHDLRRVPPPRALRATLDAEATLTPTGPEVFGLRQQLGQRSHSSSVVVAEPVGSLRRKCRSLRMLTK